MEFSYVAVCYSDVCVGGIACRCEKTQDAKVKAYIMTIGVLPPYRNMGIGSALLREVLKLITEDSNIHEIYLHVQVDALDRLKLCTGLLNVKSPISKSEFSSGQVNNEDAVRFYQKHGFEVVDKIVGYYKRLDPPDCFLLKKDCCR